MNIPNDSRAINDLIADATYIAERSKHPLAWHAVQQLQQLRNPLHKVAERAEARAAVNALYMRPGFSCGTPAYEGILDDVDALAMALETYLDNDPICEEARSFGRVAVETAIDQQREYESLDYAIYCHHINACDTLAEVFHALRGDLRFVAARDALDQGFREALAGVTVKPDGLITAIGLQSVSYDI